MRLTSKMLLFTAILALFMLFNSALGLFSTTRLDRGLKQIVNQDIPINDAVRGVSIALLRQTGTLQRAMSQASMGEQERVARTAETFDEESVVLEGLVESTRHLLALLSKDSHQITELHSIQLQMDAIMEQLDVFNEDAYELLDVLTLGQVELSASGFADVQWKMDHLDELINLVLVDVTDFTQAEASRARAEGRRFVDLIKITSPLFGLLSLAAAIYLLRNVNRTLGADPSELAKASEALAVGRLTGVSISSTKGVAGTVQRTIIRLREVIDSIQSGAGKVATTAEHLGLSSSELNARTQEQGSALEEVAASMAQMAKNVAQNAGSTAQAHKIAQVTRAEALAGANAVTESIAAMNRISSSSRRINEILLVIQEIASQTNLLALNAGVEAARAGRQGQGFAVIAREVRSLADRSATAAKDIQMILGENSANVGKGAELAQTSGETLKAIVTSALGLSDVVAEIAAASSEQSHGISDINKAVSRIESVTQKNAILVKKVASVSQALNIQAEELSGAVSFFKLATNKPATTPASARIAQSAMTASRSRKQGKERPTNQGTNLEPKPPSKPAPLTLKSWEPDPAPTDTPEQGRDRLPGWEDMVPATLRVDRSPGLASASTGAHPRPERLKDSPEAWTTKR